LGNENIRKFLKNFGLTEKEIETYIFLAKHGASRSIEIVKGIKTHKAEVYRVLKSLQTKGLVVSTIEFPARFTAVTFETALDSFIKIKREELTSVENARQELLEDWKTVRITGMELPLEKFVIVEGNRRIYPKILQMIQETRNQLSALSTVGILLRADQFGLFEAIASNPLKSNISFRFLTELSRENLNAAKTLLKKIGETGLDFKGRTPELGLQLAPQLIVRDEEEILLFITSKESPAPGNDQSLWTNCKTIVQSFNAVFEDLWRNSTDIKKRICEIETGKPTPQTSIISDADIARNKYNEALRRVEEEIVIKTSTEGLIASWKNMPLIKEWARRGISVRIMAPLVSDNLQAAQELSEYCSIRHMPVGYTETTIVDGKHLFQFRERLDSEQKSRVKPCFENALYTTDVEYVEKTKSMLNALWKNASPLSSNVPRSACGIRSSDFNPLSGRPWLEDVNATFKEIQGGITEKDVLKKILNAKKLSPNDTSKGAIVMYGSLAQAIIHPPDYFNLPEMRIFAWHIDEQSRLGAEDMLQIFLWLETPLGYTFVPVATIGNNPEGVDIRKKSLPMHNQTRPNHQLANKDELYVRIHGNTLLAGWTVPIPLLPPPYKLPPGCILFEAYGQLKTGMFEVKTTWGRTHTYEFNGFEAFVTFFHQVSKYEGPGTDGLLYRDLVLTSRSTSSRL
jgi:sugar-specific transcriptional regulator TrmB